MHEPETQSNHAIAAQKSPDACSNKYRLISRHWVSTSERPNHLWAALLINARFTVPADPNCRSLKHNRNLPSWRRSLSTYVSKNNSQHSTLDSTRAKGRAVSG